MRFIIDECIGPTLAHWLRDEGHDVYSVFEQSRGIRDDEILTIAVKEKRILVTNDKDFGDLVFRGQRTHEGVILLRQSDPRPEAMIHAMRQLLADYAHQIEKAFVVVTDTAVRINK